MSRHTSSSSRHSNRSASSSVIAEKRAKAEAARVMLEYAEKETGIRKRCAVLEETQQVLAAQTARKKADLNADLVLLQIQKEAAGAEAEYKAFESDCDKSNLDSVSKLPCVSSEERTRQYVQQHSVQQEVFVPKPDAGPDPTRSPPQPFLSQNPRENLSRVSEVTMDGNSPHQKKSVTQPRYSQNLNPNAATFRSSNHQTVESHLNEHASTFMGEMSRFLMKKELVLSRLTKFDDRPESYAIWKASFQTIVKELELSPNEELDLLVKYLGIESSRHAHSLRAANVHDPFKGLNRTWERLDERYGCPEMVEASLKNKLSSFPKLTNRDSKRLYDLSDILGEIESVKEQEQYQALLSYFDSSSGVIPIISKLPYSLQERWTSHAFKYKKMHDVPFPPFSVLVDFIREMSKVKNDPSFLYENTQPPAQPSPKRMVSNKKTDVVPDTDNSGPEVMKCPIHRARHSLSLCRTFKTKSYEERKEILKKNKICFKCCASSDHRAADCKEKIKCDDCGKTSHTTALHNDAYGADKIQPRTSEHSGEVKSAKSSTESPVTSKCTQVCGSTFHGKSCAKTVLVKLYPVGQPESAIRTYAILDDQSNSSLAKRALFEVMNIHSASVPYTLSSCSGQMQTSGRRAKGYAIESLDGTCVFELPTLIECEQIPNVREEIPTPDVVQYHHHLQDLVDLIPPLDEDAEILLLIGRDLIDAHHVLDHRIGPPNSPYAQKLPLGWVVIGDVCLGKVHQPSSVNVNKTYLLPDGRTSVCSPCPNMFSLKLKEGYPDQVEADVFSSPSDDLGKTVFDRTNQDDKLGMSIEDREFLHIMDQEMVKDDSGSWTAPLPFRSPRPPLPNNRSQALNRANALRRSLLKDSVKKEHFVTFMEQIFENNHAELAPPLQPDQECWYLPIFGVYHPKKPDRIRAVFDSSAQHNGISLNNVLLQGPDLTNSLLGVLLRFRKEPVAIMADIGQMFYCFRVREDHRRFLRFLWHRDNDPNKELVDYQMCVHVFGNSPSPAVATYGLRKTVHSVEVIGADVKDFIDHDFYVDDGLVSLPTVDEAIDLMKRTQQALRVHGNLRLHKIASNHPDVVAAFPAADRAKDLTDLDLGSDLLPLQRSLGMTWDLNTDDFLFQVSSEWKPYTKRGMLSTVNSLFDPMGFAAPVIIQGKILLRDLISRKTDWDETLSDECQKEWEKWRESLNDLGNLRIPRTYLPGSFLTTTREVHIYSDASEKAIAAVAYLKTTDPNGKRHVGFILGKAKVAPTHGHTIPRLELCAAVLAVEIADMVSDQLDIPSNSMCFYSDSRIVLGYIHNKSRRFYVYVSNRVQRIRRSSKPEQWSYVSTETNPADHGTRSLLPLSTECHPWLNGPKQLFADRIRDDEGCEFPLSDPTEDKEIRPEVVAIATKVDHPKGYLGSHRFQHFSCWKRLVRTIVRMKQLARSLQSSAAKVDSTTDADKYREAELFIIHQVQMEVYAGEMKSCEEKRPLSLKSAILNLSPFLDEKNTLRVGGRLKHAELPNSFKNPLIIPGDSHIATLLVRHYHASVAHQGRHFTDGAVRSAGLWITGGKRLISSLIHKCVKCRKLRGKQEIQKMADLPADRLEPSPPFTYVGVDTFGPWLISTRRTRGGTANSKRWAILFTCLVVRAIHIEVIDELSSSAFINALRRFTSIRGKVTIYRSDRGTNFIGATDALKIDAVNVEDGPVKQHLYNSGTEWIFNPPHSSHMGGVWERMIGVTRRILDSLMTTVSLRSLTHDVLCTFMAEVCAIINARPVVPISSDPETPFILSPSTLLTHKTDHVSSEMDGWDIKDMYRAQWKQVQVLAEMFWKRWKNEYLPTLQPRRKWQQDQPNIKEGDIVLLRDKNSHRNEWPVAVVIRVIPSADDMVRKAVLRVVKNGQTTTYTRPISEMIILLSKQE